MTEYSCNEIQRLDHGRNDHYSGGRAAGPGEARVYTAGEFRPRSSPHRRLLLDVPKRGIDFLVSLILLLIFSPLLIVIASMIKATSAGPIFYRQARHGRNMQTFSILKFRSMYDCDGSQKFQQATKDDPRVTWMGRFLRATSLDELPQLFNVLKGDMSLVGPRPHAVEHDQFFADRIPGYWERYNVLPGITGWAQIHGYRGETPTVEVMQDRVRLDIWYVRNRSLLLDIKVLLLTPRVTFGGNAY